MGLYHGITCDRANCLKDEAMVDAFPGWDPDDMPCKPYNEFDDGVFLGTAEALGLHREHVQRFSGVPLFEWDDIDENMEAVDPATGWRWTSNGEFFCSEGCRSGDTRR